MHLLFSVGTPAAMTVQVLGGHHGHGGHLITTGSAAPGMADMAGMHTGSSMWVAHALAAVVTIVALRFGERAFWDLLALARTSLAVVFRVVALVIVPRVELRHRVPRVLRSEMRELGVCVDTSPHRGPPATA
ncbi:hypothetical protein [Clavibacter zhangzhiyongii]|uniref:Uncharacterized protein n=1 Tax=Clavibacter zhangzhiyongii TaxID=2768071 RepID=A0A7L7YYW0_9MICO|nr:hypothetical protein [Clavibacter zhangzhiyongii]QOD42661.1 hypothetical protein H9X71_08375 [Clavibacter zhangzhiyongii]